MRKFKRLIVNEPFFCFICLIKDYSVFYYFKFIKR